MPDLRNHVSCLACSSCRAAEAPTESLPTPTIKIDNQSDPFATIVKVDFGDRLGELLDTVRSYDGRNCAQSKLLHLD